MVTVSFWVSNGIYGWEYERTQNKPFEMILFLFFFCFEIQIQIHI